jgi:hypothetical protein
MPMTYYSLLYIVEISSYPQLTIEHAENYSTFENKKFRCTKTLAKTNAFLYKLVSQLYERDFFQKGFSTGADRLITF